MLMADYAKVDSATGKLSIVGAFNRVCAESFPATIRRFCFAISFRGCRQDERASHCLLVKLVDEAGRELIGSEGTIRFPLGAAGNDRRVASVFEYNDVVIKESGEHRFQVSINDGEFEESIAIPIVQMIS